MGAPAATTTTTAGAAPTSESATTTDQKQQQTSDTPPKKRKLEEVGFHHSPYYKIRATVADLRGRFLKVCQTTDSQKKGSALEILKEIKFIMQLSKETRLDLYSALEPGKPAWIPRNTSEDEPAGKISSTEKNQAPPISLAGKSMQNSGGNMPLKPGNLQAVGQKLVPQVEIKNEARTSKVTDDTKQPSRVLQGSYVIGGSPIGCNFLMWPGSEVAYYGLTKAEWLARQSSK